MQQRGLAPTLVALAALLGAAVAAFVLPSPATISGPRAARAFLDAWERSLRGTYVVESRFTRTLVAGPTFTGETSLAQRPPDRLFVGLGTVDGRIDGHRIDCATTVSGELRCFPGVAADFEADVQREVGVLRAYVDGEDPLYLARWDGGHCFALVLMLDLTSPPYGKSARFCFDGRTGAPTVVEVRRAEGDDRTVAVSLRAEVTDDDFVLPTDAGDLPG